MPTLPMPPIIQSTWITPSSWVACDSAVARRALRDTSRSYECSDRFPPARDQSPDRQNDDRANHRTDQPGALISTVPAKHLAEKRRHERPNDTENRREHEAARLIVAGHDELRDYTR